MSWIDFIDDGWPAHRARAAASVVTLTMILMAAFVGLSGQGAHAQSADRGGAELLMHDMMPSTAHCGTVSWEPLSYCRYEAGETSRVVFELSFGPDGPQGSLSYDIGDSDGRRLLQAIYKFFSSLGIAERDLGDCIRQSKSKASEVLAGAFRVKCRYADVADRVGYEIFSERILLF